MRVVSGQFKPGQSGNPKGRPKGTSTSHKLRGALGKDLDKLIRQIVEKALAGDMQAARLVLERTVASLKPVETAAPISLPEGPSADQGAAILRAVAGGELAPGQAAVLLNAVANLARVIELAELEARIRALEGRDGDKP